MSAPAPAVEKLSLDILEDSFAARVANLKSGDHRRYRVYCTNRLQRVRHAVFGKQPKQTKQQGKAAAAAAKPSKSPTLTIAVETVKDERHLLLVLITAERAWAHAQELKDDALMNQDDDKPTDRLRLHQRKRLKKAVKVASQLLTLARAVANERTVLDAEAYLASMRAALATAQDNWPEALAQHSRANAIYKQMLSLTQTVALTKQVREIDTLIEYCVHRLAVAGVSAKQVAAASASALENFDDALTRARAAVEQRKQSEATALTYRGITLHVAASRVRASLLRALEAEEVVSKDAALSNSATTSLETMIESDENLAAAYGELLLEVRDALSKADVQSAPHLSLLRRAVIERRALRSLARYSRQFDALVAARDSSRAVAPLCATLMASSAALAGAAQSDEPSGVAADRATSTLASASAVYWSAARAWSLARQRAASSAVASTLAEAAALLNKAQALLDDAAAALANAATIATTSTTSTASRDGLVSRERVQSLRALIAAEQGAVRAKHLVLQATASADSVASVSTAAAAATSSTATSSTTTATSSTTTTPTTTTTMTLSPDFVDAQLLQANSTFDLGYQRALPVVTITKQTAAPTPVIAKDKKAVKPSKATSSSSSSSSSSTSTATTATATTTTTTTTTMTTSAPRLLEPTALRAVPVKPMMFDLAMGGIAMPDLAARTQQAKPAATSSWFGSLFGR